MRGNDAPIARSRFGLPAESARVPGGLVVLAGNGNPALAQRICDELGVPLGRATIGKFPDGEVHVVIHTPVAGTDVIIVQSTPSDSMLMELLLMANAAKLSGACRVIAVVSYLCYFRQDRRQGQEPLSAALVARQLELDCDGVIALDLHNQALESVFRIPIAHLLPIQAFVEAWRQAGLDMENLAIASPDPGGAKRAASYCQALGSDDNLIVMHKRRINGGAVQIMGVSGDVAVAGRQVMLVDDIVASGQTLLRAAESLILNGASRVHASVTHLVLPTSLPNLLGGPLAQVFVTDSLPLNIDYDKLKIVSVAPILAGAIARWTITS